MGSPQVLVAHYLPFVNTILRVLNSKLVRGGWRKAIERGSCGKAAAGGVRYEYGKRKAEPVRKVQGDWHSRDWERASGNPTLVARDARWRGREAAEEEEKETKGGKRHGEEEVGVDCGHEDRTEAGACGAD